MSIKSKAIEKQARLHFPCAKSIPRAGSHRGLGHLLERLGGRSLAWPPDLRLPSQTASWARPPAFTEFTFHLATYEREAQEQREPEAAKRALQLPSDLGKELGSAGNMSFDNSS